MAYMQTTPADAVAKEANKAGPTASGRLGEPARPPAVPLGNKGNPFKVANDADFEKVGKGLYYVGPDNKLRQK